MRKKTNNLEEEDDDAINQDEINDQICIIKAFSVWSLIELIILVRLVLTHLVHVDFPSRRRFDVPIPKSILEVG